MRSDRVCAATVTPKAEKTLLYGHPWVYDTEVVSVDGEWENGDIIDVVNKKGAYLGSAFISKHSKIRLRIVSRNANDKFDREFWKRRISYAWRYRKQVMGDDTSCCRVIFGEADTFPGLTADLFNNIIVTQILSVGFEKIKDTILPLIKEVLSKDGIVIDGIYERNDVALREHEGLTQYIGWYGTQHPDSTVTEITENGIKYAVDFENGQKTGYFLDQKYNRLAVAKYAKGKNVLDCFTHTGSFALNAAMGGAKSVHALDISETAVDMVRDNAKKNGLDGIVTAECVNVFDFLPQAERKYDFIILDPPAFTKSRKTIDNAMRGYKEINLRAMKLLPRGGYLATCSCSHFADEERFKNMLSSAAADAGVRIRQIEARQQSPDHPILWGVPETNYLKFFIFQIV